MGNVSQIEKVTARVCSKQYNEVCLLMIFDGVSVNMRLHIKSEVRGSLLCV